MPVSPFRHAMEEWLFRETAFCNLSEMEELDIRGEGARVMRMSRAGRTAREVLDQAGWGAVGAAEPEGVGDVFCQCSSQR